MDFWIRDRQRLRRGGPGWQAVPRRAHESVRRPARRDGAKWRCCHSAVLRLINSPGFSPGITRAQREGDRWHRTALVAAKTLCPDRLRYQYPKAEQPSEYTVERSRVIIGSRLLAQDLLEVGATLR